MADELRPDFTGRLDAYLEWAAEHFRPSPLFCGPHWAPCSVDGKPGLLMSIILQTELMSRMPADVGDHTGMNSWMANRLTPLCCELGDERMTWLWDELDQPHCSARPPAGHLMANGRVCWKRPDHRDPHEWETPASVFALMPCAPESTP